MRLAGTAGELTSAADTVEALTASLDAVTATRAMETYRFAFDLERPNDVLPFNPGSGRCNPVAPEVAMRVEGRSLVAECTFTNCYESAPDTVHGGMLAAVFDQVVSYAPMIDGKTGPTLKLSVSFLKAAPIETPLRFEAATDSVDGRKYSVSGVCWNGEEKVAEAEALILCVHDIRRFGVAP